jgi:fatty-acyl-CoA synthase
MAEYGAIGIRVYHAWGMTESSPRATWNMPKLATLEMDHETQLDQQATQGRTVFGIDVRAENDAGEEVPWDGKTQGLLKFRGHWVRAAPTASPRAMSAATAGFPPAMSASSTQRVSCC